MSGVLAGLRVLDLSWGVSGPIAGMLLADNGASVTKIEPPGGDPFRSQSGYQVWNRGKRSAVIDLNTEAGVAAFRGLAATSDVLLESFSPGTMARWGLDWDSLAEDCPQLVYCSISGYGQTGRHSQRPGYDALVAARTGQQWESRGTVGGTISRLAGSDPILPGLEAPEGCWRGAPRGGPLFSGIPWPSLSTAYLATLAISAGLRAREVTGAGQWVQTSLLQGILVTTASAWQRVERPDAPNYQSWVNDPRAPHGIFQCADDRWIQQWVALPSFLLSAAAGGNHIAAPEDLVGTRHATDRIGPQAEEMVVLHHYQPLMAEAVRRFSSTVWSDLAAEVGVPLQIIRSPEEALLDPALHADGCVVEVKDPALGSISQVGRVYEIKGRSSEILYGPAELGQHTEEVLAEAASANASQRRAPARDSQCLAHPLEGITVLDLGLAVAGPYGAQLLSDLGADVIKVNRPGEEFWMSSVWAMLAHRGKRSIGLDLKVAEAQEILHRLVADADVVIHNMRSDAAQRIGVDEPTLRKINPSLVYCHTRGHDRGIRESLPGNDQTAGAIAGTQWVEGAVDDGGMPLWPCISLGDPGNGLLAAIGVVQAIYERDRTGEGQSVDTAIVNAHLLNTSSAWIASDGSSVGERPRLDRMQLGWGALYRLYETNSGWLCLAVCSDTEWESLRKALGSDGVLGDARFESADMRGRHDEELAATLADIFKERSADYWFELLDAEGVPCEISTPDFVLDLFDDEEFIAKNWVTSYDHPWVGKMEAAGLLFDFSATPGRIAGPPFIPGQHSREILETLGYSEQDVSTLLAGGAAFLAGAK